MDINETMEKTLQQARELQQKMNEAVNKAAEQMKPQLEESLRKAGEIQATLSKHAAESTEMASGQAKTLLGHVNDFIKMGGEAMRSSAEQTRAAAEKMMEQSRKIVESAGSADKNDPGSAPPTSPSGG